MVNREKQADVLRRTQAKRKEQKKEQVLKAIQEIQKQKKPLTFKNIATVAGCSVSYLYKWDDIKAYIHELQQKKETTLNSLEESEGKYQPHSLKTLHQVAKDKIRKLEEEIRELKRQNELLRGHLVEVYELRDECERLRKLVRKYEQEKNQSKVVPLYSLPEKPEEVTTEPTPSSEPEKRSIPEEIEALGLEINSTLKKTIKNTSEETILAAIEAVKDQLSRNHVTNPAGLLNKAIKEGWTKNQPSYPPEKPISQPQHNESTPAIDEAKKLVSPDQLKNLSTLFKDKDNE